MLAIQLFSADSSIDGELIEKVAARPINRGDRSLGHLKKGDRLIQVRLYLIGH